MGIPLLTSSLPAGWLLSHNSIESAQATKETLRSTVLPFLHAYPLRGTLFTYRFLSMDDFFLYYSGYLPSYHNIVAYLLKTRAVESQQPAITRQRCVNNNRGMAFSAQSVPMTAHAKMGYVMPSLSNNCTATEERYLLRSPCREVISRSSWLFIRDKPTSRQRCYIRTMTESFQF
jgi:hypothetical protein